MKRTNLRHLFIFSSVTLSSGWLGYLADLNMGPQPQGATLGMGLWLVLPLVTALLLLLFTKDKRIIGLHPHLLKNTKWYGLSFLIFPAVTLLIILAGILTGWIETTTFNANTYFHTMLLSVLPNFIKNFFEESVWRGYLTGSLLKAKMSDLRIYLLVGGIWGAWHIPYYLFFLPESMLAQILTPDRWLFALTAFLTMICWTVMYVELYRITKSIWPVVILHMMEDAVVNHLIIDKHILIQPGKAILISPVLGIATTCIYLTIGLLLRKKRQQLDAATGSIYQMPQNNR